MSKSILTSENLSKAYRIGLRSQLPDTLFGVFTRWLQKPLQGARRLRRLDTHSLDFRNTDSDVFWALREVSFEITEGEVVGIIGRNGAGKSTLLKLLSRITEPTLGRAVIHGRVSSLLEVGTGFHPDLTGRENVYMNGTLLGMTKREIDRKFDQIVDFSGVERFLETPVKRFSSGMQVRLAFAVAAHLDPEILIIDEVLSVGDAEFQKRCLGKVREVSTSGRTVLFVSHKMEAVSRLCSRAILLHEGRIQVDGSVEAAVTGYLENITNPSQRWSGAGPGNEIVRLLEVRSVDSAEKTSSEYDIESSVSIQMEYEVIVDGHVLVPNVHFFAPDGTCLFVSHDVDEDWRDRRRPIGRYMSSVTVPGNFFSEGEVTIGVTISSYHPFVVHLYEENAIGFRIIEKLGGGAARGPYAGHVPGVIRPLLQWRTEFKSIQ